MRKEYDFSKGKRGPVVQVPKGKTRITIRIDDDILAWFRDQVEQAGGGNYQTLMNVALREYIQGAAEPLEKTLRRVLREDATRISKDFGNFVNLVFQVFERPHYLLARLTD